MKVVAVFGGLGSQMFKYAFYLYLKEKSGDQCFIDTSFFIGNKSWNGYELKKLFKINEPDWKNYLSINSKSLMRHTKATYPKECLKTMVSISGKTYYNCLGSVLTIPNNSKIHYIRYKIFKSYINRIRIKKVVAGKTINRYDPKMFENHRNIYFDEFDHRSDQYFKDIKDILKKQFQFPSLEGDENKKIAITMKKGNSVAVHVRRTDHMFDNADLIERGYFNKAINYIKSQTKEKLSFFIFSDDISWCKKHLHKLGLTPHDSVYFIDWNIGDKSYIDMQLMTYCQHNVIPISSFSWWGYYLSDMQNKIVCAPHGYWLEVEHHF